MHHLDLDTLTLAAGAHEDRADGVCLLEAVAWWAGEPHTDRPACVSPALGTFGRHLSDALPDSKRQELRQFVPQLPGTAEDGRDETRGYIALDWLVRAYAPAWLDLAGLTTEATALRDLRRITDLTAAQSADPVVRDARNAAGAGGFAAGYAARAAARDAAGTAAGYAARAAAGDAAWDAAGAAAWAAARNAAGAAAWAAARNAAGDKLAPTVARLQDSAIALFATMIHPAA